MNESAQFLLQYGYGYILFFLWVLVDQVGLPLPVFPVLLAAGALAGARQVDLATVVLLAALASMLGSALWYEIGRRRGSAVLGMLCRMALEPDSCVRRSENMFSRHSRSTLLMARFVPGLSAVAAPVAGMFSMPRLQFSLLNSIGSLLWAGSFIGLGYLFSEQLEQVSALVGHLSGWLMLLAALLGLYAGLKYGQRWRFLRSLRVARIAPEELKWKLDAGEEVVIVDLRHGFDFQRAPQTLPQAIRLDPEELEERHSEIPTEREVVLYCT